jgi:hypothetical protein
MLRTMFKLGLAGIAGAAFLSAAPASAQVTGNVNVTGFVGASCAAVTSVSGTIALGNLAKPDGTVANLNGVAHFRVNCNGATPHLSLTATSMATSAPAGAGFTNTVRYDAHMAVDKAAGGQSTLDYSTATGGPAATLIMPSAIASPASDNVHITVDTLSTAVGTDVLVAGNYGVGLAGGTGGVITFTISNS